MSIFKSSFSPTVQEQLKRRQDAMIDRKPQSIQYINSRNAWIRMTSSVNVNGSSDLAKQYILQSGTLSSGVLGNILKSGIGNNFNINAYSPSGRDSKKPYQRGIRPMPGITSIDVKSKSAYGSLREVTVNFQCWDIQQLEDLEVLYMRPGYTALVEWGWTPYLDNAGVYQPNFNDYYDILNKPQTDRTVLFKELYDKSVKYHGNYDAMFGYIKNYQWSARPDGGYDCNATIISTGEIIESLKINYILPTKIEKADQGVLSKEFANQGGYLEEWTQKYQKNILAGIWAEALFKIKDPKATYSTDSIFKDRAVSLRVPYATSTNTNDPNSISSGNIQSYITLDCMFDILNKYVIAKSKVDGKPLVELSLYSTEYDGNGKLPLYCTAHPLQVSVDPSVCLIKSPLWSNEGTQTTVIQQTQAIVSNDPAVVIAQEAFKLIQIGYKGGSFGGTDEASLLAGIKKITTKEIYSAVEVLLANSKDGFGYPNLQAVLQGELGKGDYDLAEKQIKPSLESIAGIKVNVVPVVVAQQSTGKTLAPTDVDSINITTSFTVDQTSGQAQSTIAVNSGQAIASISFLKDLKADYFYNSDPYSEIGIIKNIYVNVDYLYQKAVDLNIEASDTKEKNEINLYNYIKTVIRDIQSAIGSVSTFEIHVDPVDNKIARVIDINYTEPEKAVYDKLFELQLHNLESVVRSYSLQSQIFPEQSSIIAIGSQAKGGQLGMQTNTMIDFNRNLTDRIIPEKVDGQSSDVSIDKSNPNITNGLAQIITAFASFGSQATTLSPDNKPSYDELASNAKTALRDVIAYFQSVTTSPGSNRNLIPTKLSIEMDGIGGLVIGHMFKLPKTTLPKGYRGENIGSQLGNTITSIGHTIANGDWITKIDTLNIVLSDNSSSIPFSELDLSKLLTIAINPSANSNFVPPALNQPNADGLKANLEQFKIATVKGNELKSGGEITQGIAASAFAVLSLIKNAYPNINLKVTAGNDEFHQKNAGSSNHKVGKAIDFTISPVTQDNLDKVEAILKDYQAKIGGTPLTFRYLNEYTNPTAKSTGGHFHISWDADTKGA
jgi:hypothetical protein